jgi:FkbM family methyltransferase
MFQTNVGHPITKEGVEGFWSNDGKLGWLIYGPYMSLEAGRYMATFHIDSEDATPPIFPSICGRVDVAKLGTIIVQTNLYDTRLARSSLVTLPFQLLQPEENIEFRVLTTGRLPLVARLPTFQKIEPSDALYLPTFPPDVEPKSRVVLDNFADFQAIFEAGAELNEDDAGPYVSFGPIKFGIASRDDIQVVNEVLFLNEYNFISSSKSTFIDVGMNAGLTSIQAAHKPNVVAVHSFEPFDAPYNRALENIARNEPIKHKIHPHKFGLSDSNREMQVNASDDTTLGNSIRGRDAGTPVTIQIRDAAEALRGIILQAKDRGENIVVKLDCEGSEFAIIKRLDEANLLRYIDIFMMEWHKWWSPGMTQNTLIVPLLRSGFKVFDRTTPYDYFAGMLYAVRGAP